MSDCTVSGSPGSRGLQVVTEGKGTFERCLLFGNAHHNLQVLSEGNPTLLDAQAVLPEACWREWRNACSTRCK